MSKKIIYAEDAIEAVHNLYAIFGSEGEWVDRKDVFEAINSLPSAQPEQQKMVQDILQYLDEYLYPIVSPEHWSVYSVLYDMVSVLSSAQPEKRTEERTETHACDLISRQAAIDALDVLCQEHRYKIPGKSETYSEYNEAWQDALDRAEGLIFNLPSAQPEIIRCRECKYADWFTSFDGKQRVYCTEYGCGGMEENDFCSHAEKERE